MYVLGLNSYNKSASAAIVSERGIVAGVEEERFSRKKYDENFPKEAIAYCLKNAGISEDELFAVMGNGEKEFYDRTKGLKRIDHVNHHYAHASSAFRISGMSKANVITVDNVGDGESMAFFEGGTDGELAASGVDGMLRKKWNIPFERISLGQIYEGVTEMMFGRHQDGKTMGLASFGKAGNPYFRIDKHDSVENHFRHLLEQIPGTVGLDLPGQKWRDIAATLQRGVEESVGNLLLEAHESNGVKDFCLAGGVFMNSKLNGHLASLDFVRKLVIQPNAGDGGLSLGLAMEGVYKETGRSQFDFSPYLGPSYSDEEIGRVLDGFTEQFEIIKVDDPAGVASEMLAQGKVIGWFQGEMEWGARALGNRSILADPSLAFCQKKVNLIKGRELWRPFGPSVLESEKDKWFECFGQTSPHMMMCFPVHEQKRDEIKGVVHVDGTSRPQTVRKEDNRLYYDLLKQFSKEKGLPVLNTSFNGPGEPIVCSPLDALKSYRVMKTRGMGGMVIGGYLVQ